MADIDCWMKEGGCILKGSPLFNRDLGTCTKSIDREVERAIDGECNGGMQVKLKKRRYVGKKDNTVFTYAINTGNSTLTKMTLSWLGDCCLNSFTSASRFFELNETSTLDETNCLLAAQFHNNNPNMTMVEGLDDFEISIQMKGNVRRKLVPVALETSDGHTCMASVFGPSCTSCAAPGSPSADCHAEEPEEPKERTCIAKGYPKEIIKETMCTQGDKVTWHKGSNARQVKSSCVDDSSVEYKGTKYDEQQDETTYKYAILADKDKRGTFTGATFAWAGDCCITSTESYSGMQMESGFDDQSCLFGAKFSSPQGHQINKKEIIKLTVKGRPSHAKTKIAINYGGEKGEEVSSCLATVLGPSCELCYDPEALSFDYFVEFNTDETFDVTAQEAIASAFTDAYNTVYTGGARVITSTVEGQFEEDETFESEDLEAAGNLRHDDLPKERHLQVRRRSLLRLRGIAKCRGGCSLKHPLFRSSLTGRRLRRLEKKMVNTEFSKPTSTHDEPLVKVSAHDHLLVSVETAEDFTASFSELLKQNLDILEDSSSLVSGRIDAIVEY